MRADGTVEAAEYGGPLFFQKTQPDGAQLKGFRPVYMKKTEGDRETHLLFYPFFVWQREPDYRSFSFFELINFRRQTTTEEQPQTTRNFDVWPFYFSRDTGNVESSYRALFPVGGTIKARFGLDRIHFILFPIYMETEKSAARTTHVLWPLLRFIDGGGQHGFEFWPLFGHRGRPGDYDSQFYLWPLIYKSAKNLSESQPEIHEGVLPFYTRDTSPGYINENYLWPFFGSTHRNAPAQYDEVRYLWPFLVQGRGETEYVNRWGPFYTHSIHKGVDKTWIAWPVFRDMRWEDDGIAQDKRQLLFFLYWSQTQRSLTNPAAAPAHKTHYWPLLSSWDNGAGQRQLQVLSPFEVFLPNSDAVRQLYTPLFALYRYDQRAPDDIRRSVLFSLLSWKSSPAEREFHFGPLLSSHSTAGHSRISLGLGLFAWQRQAENDRWKFSLFDFHSPPAVSPSPVLSP